MVSKKKRKRDTRPKYPWDKWFDGREHRLTPGVDFECEVKIMQIQLSAAARRRAIPMKTIVWDGKVLVKADPW